MKNEQACAFEGRLRSHLVHKIKSTKVLITFPADQKEKYSIKCTVSSYEIDFCLKGLFAPNWKSCYHLLTLMSFTHPHDYYYNFFYKCYLNECYSYFDFNSKISLGMALKNTVTGLTKHEQMMIFHSILINLSVNPQITVIPGQMWFLIDILRSSK